MYKITYIPKYFDIVELMPENMLSLEDWQAPKHICQAWGNFDPRLLETIDIVREKIVQAPLLCNTWHMDGNRKYCGLRPIDCSIGSKQSQHKIGRAVDLVCYKYTAEQMRQMIIANQDLLPYPVRIEDGVSWLHIDVKQMDYQGKKIYLFKA